MRTMSARNIVIHTPGLTVVLGTQYLPSGASDGTVTEARAQPQ